jgi:hypothetical protein
LNKSLYYIETTVLTELPVQPRQTDIVFPDASISIQQASSLQLLKKIQACTRLYDVSDVLMLIRPAV